MSKSKKVQLQITDKTPIINFDHVDQATVYLAKSGLDVEIVTSCSTGLNVFSCIYNLIVRSKYQMRRKKATILNELFQRVCDTSLQMATL